MGQTKTCKTCKKTKPETSFEKVRGKYRRNACYACRDAARAIPQFEIVEVSELDPDVTPPHLFTDRVNYTERPSPPMAINPSGIKKVLFVPDTHVPYHDVEKFELMLRAARVFRPDIVVIGGDFADFYAVSSHDKAPDRSRSLKDEVREVNAALTQIQELGASRVIYISGNHEDRYDRYISSRAPEFFGMASLKEIFKIEERGWEWVPYKTHFELGKLFVTHDCGKAGKFAHYDAQAAFEGNAVIFHTHRMGYAIIGSAQGKPHVACMLGWLGDLEAVDYLSKIRAKRDWAHGFGIGYLLPDESVHVVPIPIVNNQVIIEGELIS